MAVVVAVEEADFVLVDLNFLKVLFAKNISSFSIYSVILNLKLLKSFFAINIDADF